MQLISKLDREQFEPTMTFFQLTAYVKENGFPCPFQVLGVNRLLSVGALRKLAGLSRALRQSETKIVHIFFNDAAIIAPLFSKLGGAKIIVSRRDMGFWYTPVKLTFLRLSNLFVDKIVANSKAVKRNVVMSEGFPAKKIEVIYNGLDPQRFAVSPAEDFHTSIGNIEKGPVIGMVSNLQKVKRPFDLINAFSIIKKKINQAHLVFIGGGPQEIAPLQKLTRSLHIENHVHFIGRVANPIGLVKQLTVAVLCSESEGFSNAILEYLGCGKPVVCTKTGGNPELVEDGYNGFLVDVGDIKGLADRILDILSDPLLASKLSKNAQNSFGQTLASNKMAQSYMKLYEGLLISRKVRTR